MWELNSEIFHNGVNDCILFREVARITLHSVGNETFVFWEWRFESSTHRDRKALNACYSLCTIFRVELTVQHSNQASGRLTSRHALSCRLHGVLLKTTSLNSVFGFLRSAFIGGEQDVTGQSGLPVRNLVGRIQRTYKTSTFTTHQDFYYGASKQSRHFNRSCSGCRL